MHNDLDFMTGNADHGRSTLATSNNSKDSSSKSSYPEQDTFLHQGLLLFGNLHCEAGVFNIGV